MTSPRANPLCERVNRGFRGGFGFIGGIERLTANLPERAFSSTSAKNILRYFTNPIGSSWG